MTTGEQEKRLIRYYSAELARYNYIDRIDITPDVIYTYTINNISYLTFIRRGESYSMQVDKDTLIRTKQRFNDDVMLSQITIEGIVPVLQLKGNGANATKIIETKIMFILCINRQTQLIIGENNND